MTMTPVRYEGGPADRLAVLAEGEPPETVRVSLCVGPVGEQVTRYWRHDDPETPGGFVFRRGARPRP